MVKLLTFTLSVLQLCFFSIAIPFNTQDDPSTELISQDLFNIIALYGQYSAAAYCTQNYDPTYSFNTLACPSKNCQQVQSAKTNITLQLSA
jgi:hypothetical protein